MTIKENIKAIEIKISAQESMAKYSVSDSARMKSIIEIQNLKSRIKELKSL